MEILEGKRILHIGVAIPSLDHWLADFALSVIGLIVDLKTQPVPGYDEVGVHVMNNRSSSIAKQRQDLVEDAVRQKCDYLLFVDSDQIFPKDTARRLIASGKDVIGANIAVKRLPSLPTARRYEEKWPITGDVVFTTPESTGLEKIWKLGFGVMLIKMSVFEKLTVPYFNFGWRPETGFIGEDWYFCEQLTREGIELWIDHDLSKQVGHVGAYSHTHADVDHTEKLLKIVRPEEEQASGKT